MFLKIRPSPIQPFIEFGVTAGGIVIGDDVWLGSASVITDGITIGKGSVVVAGAVVTKEVPPHTIRGSGYLPARSTILVRLLHILSERRIFITKWRRTNDNFIRYYPGL